MGAASDAAGTGASARTDGAATEGAPEAGGSGTRRGATSRRDRRYGRALRRVERRLDIARRHPQRQHRARRLAKRAPLRDLDPLHLPFGALWRAREAAPWLGRPTEVAGRATLQPRRSVLAAGDGRRARRTLPNRLRAPSPGEPWLVAWHSVRRTAAGTATTLLGVFPSFRLYRNRDA
jgi:hypothetical protein